MGGYCILFTDKFLVSEAGQGNRSLNVPKVWQLSARQQRVPMAVGFPDKAAIQSTLQSISIFV